MFNFLKEKCPVCKMVLDEGKKYPEADGKKFCSEDCREKFRKELVNEQSKSGGGSCH